MAHRILESILTFRAKPNRHAFIARGEHHSTACKLVTAAAVETCRCRNMQSTKSLSELNTSICTGKQKETLDQRTPPPTNNSFIKIICLLKCDPLFITQISQPKLTFYFKTLPSNLLSPKVWLINFN